MQRRIPFLTCSAVVACLGICSVPSALQASDDQGASAIVGIEEDGVAPADDEKKIDKGKYKRRHTRVFEFLLSGQPEEARERLDKWFAAAPDDPENYYTLAVIECQANNSAAAVTAMRRALELGLAPERFIAGTHTLLEPLKETSEFAKVSAPFHRRILSGPMVADVTSSSAKVWVRTANGASVQAIAFSSTDPDMKSTSSVVESAPEVDYTAVVAFADLQSGTKYRYRLLINGEVDDTLAAWQTFTTAPVEGSPARFSIAFGGCAGYTPTNERMWETILSYQPSAMWLLGDNEYIDQPEMPKLQHYCFYRRQARPEFRRMVAGTPVYAIWDDHDFGDNDCSGGPEIESPAWKRAVWNVFRHTWINPAYGGGEKQPGCWFDYQYGDVHFIFLDGRYYRSGTEHGVDPPTMLGPVQKKWLLKTLADSKAKIKVLISPVAWTPDTKGDSPDTWQGFMEERKEIFDFLAERQINGVVLVSSDRHRSDLLSNERANGYTLYEFNSGLLTNDSVHPTLASAEFSYNDLPSFGLVEFDTLSAEASVTYRIIDINGQERFSFTVHESDLR